MGLALEAQPLPIRTDKDGVLRVSGTRVTLDTIIAAFNAGSMPEEIVLRYDSVPLEDVYLVVGYYLHNRVEVDSYLADRQQRGEARRVEAESRLSWSEVRERLLARRELVDAPPGER
jgi:uncharacterized protein (DUF433 family)